MLCTVGSAGPLFPLGGRRVGGGSLSQTQLYWGEGLQTRALRLQKIPWELNTMHPSSSADARAIPEKDAVGSLCTAGSLWTRSVCCADHYTSLNIQLFLIQRQEVDLPVCKALSIVRRLTHGILKKRQAHQHLRAFMGVHRPWWVPTAHRHGRGSSWAS